MTTDEALRTIRRIIGTYGIQTSNPLPAVVARGLFTAFDALDTELSDGGHQPSDWMHAI